MPSSVMSGGTNRSARNANSYDSLDDAEADADVVVPVDFGTPERNGSPTFFVQKIEDVVTVDKSMLINHVKIWLNNLVDLRDYDLTKGHVVCGGQAFLVTLPSIPFFRRDETDVKSWLETREKTRCPTSKYNYVSSVLTIAKAPERLLMKYLFVFPAGMICSAVMTSDLPPTTDQKCKLEMRQLEFKFTTGKAAANGKGGTMKNCKQEQQFGFWLLRIISIEAKPLAGAKVDDEDDLEDAFSGMKV